MHYVLPSVCVCMSVHARVCLHIYEYIFFPSEHSPDPTIYYCEAIDTVPINVPELIPRIGFQTCSKKKQKQTRKPKKSHQTKTPEKPHTELRSRLLLLL